MIDSHAHLDAEDFQPDLDEVIERCHERGVAAVISCGTDLASSEENLKLSEKYSMVYAAVGVHPHETYRIDSRTIDRLKKLSSRKKVVAIGETGLDYYYNFSIPEVQKKSLKLHVRLARETGLPLIIHCRNAEEDMVRILKEEKASETGGVIHCFTGSRETAHACLEFGFYLGVSGIITFRNAKELAALFVEVPLEKLLVETDSPYLAPSPHRGRRNEPSFVMHTAAKLAELRSVTLKRIQEITDANTRELFRLA